MEHAAIEESSEMTETIADLAIKFCDADMNHEVHLKKKAREIIIIPSWASALINKSSVRDTYQNQSRTS